MEHLEVVTGPIVTVTGNLSANSPVVTGLVTSALAGAVFVSGTGIAPGTFVLSIDSPSQLTLTQPATTSGSVSLDFTLEPLTLAEAKLHLRLEIPDDDSLVATLIEAARLRAQALLRMTLLSTTYNWYQDQFPASANGYYNRLVRMMGPNPQWLPNGAAILYVPNPPLVSVASVQYWSPMGVYTTVDPSIYFVSTGLGSRIQPLIGHVWPVVRPQIDGVAVQYTAGYPTADSIPASVKAACKLMVGHWYEHREEVIDGSITVVPNAVDALLSATDPGLYA
jgi:hypothetical protein